MKARERWNVQLTCLMIRAVVYADKEDVGDDEFTFGVYQPTMVSTTEGWQSRRQSVR